MTRDEYIDDIKISLGYPIVDIEIDEIIGKLVDKAFREISQYVVDTTFMTVSYAQKGIDVSKYNIDSIQYVLRTTNPSRVSDFTDIYVLSTINTANASSTNLMMSDYLYRTQLAQLKSTITTDLDWTFDKKDQKLYINTYYPNPLSVTIVYTPNFKDVSEITEQFWINYINRLSLAFCKESLGRVRGKYDLSSSLYKLDGNSLVSEGISERDAIRQELTEMFDLTLPID